MEQIESYELSLCIKQLKLVVKFPCKLTFQHGGKPITAQIQSNGTNVFAVNRDINLKQQTRKDYLQITINLTTEKGGNIMAGIIKINLKDAASSQGQTLNISLQKCLDPYSTCSIMIKSVKMNRSRVKKINMVDQKRNRQLAESKFQTKSQAPFVQSRDMKSRLRYNQAESFTNKRVSFNQQPGTGIIYNKEKALSTAGFKVVKDNSFDKQDFNSRFKHLNRRVEEQDSKTVITGKWRETDEKIKTSIQTNEKSLKLQIIKYKTKFQESERNIEDKVKQIKILKDQISDINRQLSEKQYLIEQISIKTNQINKLEENNKLLSKELHQERNKIIDLERQLQQEKNINGTTLVKLKQEHDKKQYQFQKMLYQKKQELKEILQQNQYKVNQINKMKVLIQDLEKTLEIKVYQYQKNYNAEKNEHNKTKNTMQSKINQLKVQFEESQLKHGYTTSTLKNIQEENVKLQKKIKILQQSLFQTQKSVEYEANLKDKLAQDKKRLQKTEDELQSKIKILQKQFEVKQKELAQANIQLNDVSNNSKKKINELLQKNKIFSAKTQQLENKVNIMNASEEKLKRNLQLAQKQAKSLQQNQKIINKNIKIKEQKILQLEKEISDLQNKNSIKQNLNKKDAEYKNSSIQKLNFRLAEIQRGLQKQKEHSQDKRLQLLKSENKVKMLEESSARLTELLKDTKATSLKRQQQLQSTIKQLNDQIKLCESKQSQLNKELHSNDIQKINLKNEISKLEKTIQNNNQRFDRLKKREGELQIALKNINKELQERTEQFVQFQTNYKNLQNDFKMMQADKSKTQKITNIISEEKDLAKNDINKLKKQIEKREQKEEQYMTQIKIYKEQITKLELKNNSITKEYQKFKNGINDSIKNTMTIKQAFTSLDNSMIGGNLQNSKIMQRSRGVKVVGDYSFNLQSGQNKFGQAIQNFAKQSQQTISILNEDLRKIKKQRENLQKQYNLLMNRARQSEQHSDRAMKDMSNEIEQIISRSSYQVEEYEEKISQLQKQNLKKDKAIKELMAQLQQMSINHDNQRSSNQIGLSDLLSKIDSLKYKISEWEKKDQNQAAMFVNFQEKIIELEQESMELRHQLEIYEEYIAKRDKIINQKTQQFEDIRHELDLVKKSKSDISIQLLSYKESSTVDKENVQRLLADIKDEENKNMQLKGFNSDLLREKEGLIKKDFQKTEKIYNLQETIQHLMLQVAEKNQQISKKNISLNELRDISKNLQIDITSLQSTLAETKLNLQKERERLKQRDRRISSKDSESQNLNNQIKKVTAKFEIQVTKLTQQLSLAQTTINREREDNLSKINDLETQIKKLKENQKKINQSNLSLQQQIFFEKQTNSLNNSKIQELKQQITDLQIQNSKLSNQIVTLTDQVKEKEETLYSLSGKLYASDTKLESKQQQFKHRLEKAQLDWRYKLQQICEQYENKLQIIERQKNYVRTGMDQFNQNVHKLQNQKNILRADLDKEKDIWEAKIKKIQEEKLNALIQKNRQIQKLRQVIEEIDQKIKRKDYQYKNLQQDKRKVQQKMKDLRSEVEKADEKKNQAVRVFQKEIDQLKRKEGQLKRFKDALKNNQWTIQRQIKKGIQNCTKSIVSLSSEETKGEIMDIMRNLEGSISKAACPNIDQL